MKIKCSSEEAQILIRNCNMEQCEFCFLKEVCHDNDKRGNIQKLMEISNRSENEE